MRSVESRYSYWNIGSAINMATVFDPCWAPLSVVNIGDAVRHFIDSPPAVHVVHNHKGEKGLSVGFSLLK